jgi:hypothetical protein
MQHVTVYVTNPRSAHIATEAMLDRTLIAMSSDIDETVTGFVQSIEEDWEAVPGDGALRFLKLTASTLHWSYHSCGLARQGSNLNFLWLRSSVHADGGGLAKRPSRLTGPPV